MKLKQGGNEMKRIRKGKQLLAIVLSVLLVISGLPAVVFAKRQAEKGLCEHHPEHTADCGYVQAQPCEHEHTEDCYTDELICNYIESEDTTASDSEADHTHVQEWCYRLDCPHERGEHKVNGSEADREGVLGLDADCGYDEGKPCKYICEFCRETYHDPEPDLDETERIACTLTGGCALAEGHEGECVTDELSPEGLPAKNITSWTFADNENLTEGELALLGVSDDKQADFDTVVSMLPTQIRAEVEGEADPVMVDVTGWGCLEYVRDQNGSWPVSGEFTFTADLEPGYSCVPLPAVTVLLGGGQTFEGVTNDVVSFEFEEDTGTLTTYTIYGTTIWRERGIDAEKIKKLVVKSSELGIYDEAFQNCTELTSVIIEEGITGSTGMFTFKGCTKLESVTIPGSMALGMGSFNGCTNLVSVTLGGMTASSFPLQTPFEGIPNLVIYVPDGATGYDNWPEKRVVKGSALALSALEIGGVTLTPSFQPGTYAYTATVPAAMESVTVTPASTGKILVDGKNVASGTFSDPVVIEAGGSKEIEIVVKTNENLSRTYTIAVTREAPTSISTKEIQGVTAPVRGAVPVSSITKTAQYTGKVSWSPKDSVFAADTAYTATITLDPEAGYTLAGVPADFFTVAGADSVTHQANSGTITVKFSRTDKPSVSLKSIEGIAVPVRGGVPVSSITETEQYTGKVSWNPSHTTFEASTVYTATVTLSPKAGFTLNGVEADCFTVAGAASVTNAENSGEIKVVFPKTGKQVYTVTVEHKGNGSASASSASAVEGTAITLSAEADKGYYFKEWQVISGGIAITNNQFTMPAGNVTVKAIFEKNRSGSSGGNSFGRSNSYPNQDILNGTWIQTNTGGWMFRQTSGVYAKNRWGLVDGQWYYFDSEGRMVTGWQFLSSQWFYLDPNGAMVTGWREIDGKWYYFNPVSDGTKGSMMADRIVNGEERKE